MAKLTKRTVEGLAPAGKDYFLWDSEVAGFGVRVMASGKKSYLIQYRSGGRTRRVTLGRHGTVTADAARKRAKELLGAVAKGENPAEDIHIHRRGPTFASICDRFLKEYVPIHCKPSTAGEYRRSVELFIKPALGSHKIIDIARPDIARLHHSMREIPYQANRTLGVLSKIFNLTEVWGLRPDGSNPCRHVKKFKEEKRQRFLSGEELARLGQVLTEVEADGTASRSAVTAIRLLILTGCRLAEIQTLKWSYVKGNVIELPDSKTGAKTIYLGTSALAVLASVERLPDNGHVITGKFPGRHLTDLQRPWRRIRKRAGLEGVRIHDLRHTFASHAVSNGEGLPMLGKLLGHTQVQTTARYAHLADSPVKDSSERISDHLSRALSGQN